MNSASVWLILNRANQQSDDRSSPIDNTDDTVLIGLLFAVVSVATVIACMFGTFMLALLIWSTL